MNHVWQNDAFDSNLKLKFAQPISFQIKYIGTLNISKPRSKADILAAMRQVRSLEVDQFEHSKVEATPESLNISPKHEEFEFKAKEVKKTNVVLEISSTGLTILKDVPKKITTELLHHGSSKGDRLMLLFNKIAEVFYVCQDSLDDKVFSYVSRDCGSSVKIFRCHVFKASKKAEAMKIVQTIGEAFEFSHRQEVESDKRRTTSEINDRSSTDSPKAGCSKDRNMESGSKNEKSPSKNNVNRSKSNEKSIPEHLKITDNDTSSFTDPFQSSPKTFRAKTPEYFRSPNVSIPPFAEMTSDQEIEFLRERLEQQSIQTQRIVSQLKYLEEQLALEHSTRLEVQAKAHQLLVYNRDLMDHIALLMSQLQDTEMSTKTIPNKAHLDMSSGYYFPQVKDFQRFPPYYSANESYFNSLRSPMRRSYPSETVFDFKSYSDYLLAQRQPDSMSSNNLNAYMSRQSSVSPNEKISPPQYVLQAPPMRSNTPSPYKNNSAYNDLLAETLEKSRSLIENLSGTGDESIRDTGSQKTKTIIKPLPVTTTNEEGKVRIILPVNSDETDTMSRLRINDETNHNKPGFSGFQRAASITRSTSEKTPGPRKEILAELQRWARHTTK